MSSTRSRMNKKQGGNFAALSPTDFIAAVTQHIPELVRYYAWYSNKARGVRAKTGAAQAKLCEEDRVIEKNSQASGPTPRPLARSAAPGARLRADLQRLARRGKRRRCLPALLSAQRAFGDGPCLLPGARPGHPEAQNAPEPAREAQNGVDSRSRFCKLQKIRKIPSPIPLGKRRSAPGPENQIPILFLFLPLPENQIPIPYPGATGSPSTSGTSITSPCGSICGSCGGPSAPRRKARGTVSRARTPDRSSWAPGCRRESAR